MRLIFKAFSLYCLGVFTEMYMNIFNFRVNRQLQRNKTLTDKLTVAMSCICWHLRVKLRIAEAEFCFKLANEQNAS